jgi:hypothetical protein
MSNPLRIYCARYLARKKSEGKRLGRPKGKLSAVTKLFGKDDLIREYLDKKIPQSVIARLLNVHRLILLYPLCQRLRGNVSKWAR